MITETGTESRQAAGPVFDVARVRKDFPILARKVHGKPLVYLDNAATTQKPQAVLDALMRFYADECSNIHRGVHLLSELATADYENARVKVQKFLGAADSKEIIFTRGATEGINLIAQSYGRKHVQAGDEVLISAIEHHSNIVPWQMLCEEKKATLRVAPINEKGEVILEEFRKLLGPGTRLVALTHVSNALGTVNPVREMIEAAHALGIPVLVDGAQAIQHLPVNVRELDCDFYVLSGHKIYGPTGIGVLYGKASLLQSMRPWQGGGDMISSVTFEKTTFNALPYKFEAGTPHIAGAIGLGAAIDYVESVGMRAIADHEHDLLVYATEKLSQIQGIQIVGTAAAKASVLSFTIEGIHPHDIGTILDQEGIAIRTGHHCAQPVMEYFRIPATARASFAFYNTREEIDALAHGIQSVIEVFR
jgi:cysteine desulfurase / selenocysteine lyase